MNALDGDTITVPEIIRLQGFNTPEIRSAACPEELAKALQAKAFLSSWLRKNEITLIRTGRDKYGRTLARMIPDPGPALIAQGLAEPYVCEDRCPQRKDWCK